MLQGDSAIGGIVNFQTKRPDRDNPSREAMFSYGSYGSTRTGIGLGDNFGETGAYRIDYSHNDSRVGTIDRNSNKPVSYTHLSSAAWRTGTRSISSRVTMLTARGAW